MHDFPLNQLKHISSPNEIFCLLTKHFLFALNPFQPFFILPPLPACPYRVHQTYTISVFFFNLSVWTWNDLSSAYQFFSFQRRTYKQTQLTFDYFFATLFKFCFYCKPLKFKTKHAVSLHYISYYLRAYLRGFQIRDSILNNTSQRCFRPQPS